MRHCNNCVRILVGFHALIIYYTNKRWPTYLFFFLLLFCMHVVEFEHRDIPFRFSLHHQHVFFRSCRASLQFTLLQQILDMIQYTYGMCILLLFPILWFFIQFLFCCCCFVVKKKTYIFPVFILFT